MDRLKNHPAVQKALELLRLDDERTLREQLELCAIPAPSNQEERRARDVLRRFVETGLTDAKIDGAGNVTGMIPGSSPGQAIVIAGHLDTVFPLETDVVPVLRDGVYHAPGINDDTRALAELLSLARAMLGAGLRPVRDIVFCADSGEEGLGNLRGTRHLFQTRKDIAAFLTIDDGVTGRIIYGATGSLRYKITFTARGGHSFSDFGIPNPIHAMGRAIAKIADLRVPEQPRATFSVGIVEGGASVNTIASSASMLVDSRSADGEELKRLQAEIRNAAEEAVREENRRWNREAPVSCSIELIGERPGGFQSAESPLVRLAEQAVRAVGLEPDLMAEGSTDANIPISLGIPALALGRGGEEGGIHSPGEWFRPVDAYLGPQKDLLLLLALAGAEGICGPAALQDEA